MGPAPLPGGFVHHSLERTGEGSLAFVADVERNVENLAVRVPQPTGGKLIAPLRQVLQGGQAEEPDKAVMQDRA